VDQRDQLMRDVCFISDVAVLPRWIRVSQALEYVAGVHPRFDRARQKDFSPDTIKSASKVRNCRRAWWSSSTSLSSWRLTRDVGLDEPTLASTSLYRKQFYDSLLTTTRPQPHHRRDDTSGGRDPERPHRCHVHQPRPNRIHLQHGRIRVALSGTHGEYEQVAAARALKAIMSASAGRQHAAVRSEAQSS